MSPRSPWIRFLAGVVAIAVAIRIVVDLLRPVLAYLLAAVVIAGLVIAIRWWQRNRW